MGRWRAPQPDSSPYITPAGYNALQHELKSLWTRRADVVSALSAAAAEGDRSENAEYIYRKKELAGLDRRIRYLQKRLPKLNVVRETQHRDQIFFGAWALLEDDDGRQLEYRIVGADEADAAANRISIDSPLARALLKKRVDDEVILNLGHQNRSFVVIRIRYDSDRLI